MKRGQRYYGECEYCHHYGHVYRSVAPGTGGLGWFCLGCDKTLERERARAEKQAARVP